MTKYPHITDKDFYEKINKIYKRFKVKKAKHTLESICYPKGFKLQLPQQFLSEFLNPATPYTGILVYHRIGAGKTCTAVRIAQKWIKYKRIIVVTPASLKNNFRNELRTKCADNSYLKDYEREELEILHPSDAKYKEIIKKSDDRINKYYEIYSYNKFVELVKGKKLNLTNALLIVDEIQNMISEDGSFYETLYNIIHKTDTSLRIVLLSATPMFDKPSEIALTMNLLRIPHPLPIGRSFDKLFIKTTKKRDKYKHEVKNMDLFKQYIKGYISYFRGAPPIAFPDMKIKYVKCKMSKFQYDAYLKVLKNEDNEELKSKRKKLIKDLNVSDLPNNFYIGTRVVSNIVFPSKKINEEGFKSLTDKQILNNLEKYSCKFHKIIKKISNSSGKIFIYSGFKEYGGIKSLIKVLEAYGYKNYIKDGEGKKRYAIWSGDESIQVKEEIRTVYNLKGNLDGSLIKILLGTVSIKEGVSLTGVRQVHVLEPYWNISRLEQVIGRASRFCSHKDLTEEKRNVKVHVYIACTPDDEDKKIETIDQYIQYIAIQKDKLIKSFEKAIKEAAIDCNLNKNANVYEDESDIVCDI